MHTYTLNQSHQRSCLHVRSRNYPVGADGNKGTCKWWQGGCSDVYEVGHAFKHVS